MHGFLFLDHAFNILIFYGTGLKKEPSNKTLRSAQSRFLMDGITLITGKRNAIVSLYTPHIKILLKTVFDVFSLKRIWTVFSRLFLTESMSGSSFFRINFPRFKLECNSALWYVKLKQKLHFIVHVSCENMFNTAAITD